MPHASPSSSEPSYLAGLNNSQREAVLHTGGPLLILAGAGTGKTRVLTTRITHLLVSGAARSPAEILAVTFTNKAAREMQERVAKLMGFGSVAGWMIGTFHAMGLRILRKYTQQAGLLPNFSILDGDDQLRLCKEILKSQEASSLSEKWVLGKISRWKDQALLPQDVASDSSREDPRLLAVYQAYQERLQNLNACDFSDLLLRSLQVLKKEPEVLQHYHQRIRYILVDEYQDTNTLQYLWLRLLAQKCGNLCVVGDDDQSIYGWRGAQVENILRFSKDFPKTRTFRLEQNYRSAGHILRVASHLIARNASRMGKTLWTAAGDGEKVQVRGLWDSEAEADWIAVDSAKKLEAGETTAILIRVSAQTRSFEEEFLSRGVPYVVVGAQRFYARMEVRDALAYFRAVAFPKDGLAFERILNRPKRGVGTVTISKLRDVAREQGLSSAEATAFLVKEKLLRPRLCEELGRLLDNLEGWREAMSMPTSSPRHLAEEILSKSGYIRMWEQDRNLDAPGRVENLRELTASMERFSSMPEFLEHITLFGEGEQDATQESVKLMTLHAAKGLEFDHVYLPGWEEGIFPHQNALEESGNKGLEEERRLAYVGLTRARKRAVICFAGNRNLYGGWRTSPPSRFLEELPKESIERFSDRGFWDRRAQQAQRGESHFNSNFNPKPKFNLSPSPRFKPKRKSTLFRVGMLVEHETFGAGEVLAVEGDKIMVLFPDFAEAKCISDGYLTPSKLGLSC